MMYSIGKDSSVMLHGAQSVLSGYAAVPAVVTWIPAGNSAGCTGFRDRTAKSLRLRAAGAQKNPEGVAMGINPFVHGGAKRLPDIMKTEGLKQALNK